MTHHAIRNAPVPQVRARMVSQTPQGVGVPEVPMEIGPALDGAADSAGASAADPGGGARPVPDPSGPGPDCGTGRDPSERERDRPLWRVAPPAPPRCKAGARAYENPRSPETRYDSACRGPHRIRLRLGSWLRARLPRRQPRHSKDQSKVGSRSRQRRKGRATAQGEMIFIFQSNCDNLAKLAKALKSSPNDILGFRV